MRTWQQVVGFGLLAAGLPALAADHRDAPAISERPAADINDVYAFLAPGDPDQLVLAMTINPVSDPGFAPTYAFSPGVLYQFTIDNVGGPRPEHTINIVFNAVSGGEQRLRARFPGGIVVRGDATPPSVGTLPEDPIINEGPAGSDIQVFAGQRDDPFFFDLVGFNRFRAGAGGFTGDDTFLGLNVSAIVVQFPVDLVSDGQTDLEISGFTFDRGTPAFRPTGSPLDRMGNPAVNTVFIPSAQKDRFNRGRPQTDERRFGDVIRASLDALGSDDNDADIAALVIPDTLKLNVASTGGFPNGRQLEDDVIDTLLGLLFEGTDGPTTDGVPQNDVPFLGAFPYLAEPHQAP
jgi:Domain of unknown function (DUF4331)